MANKNEQGVLDNETLIKSEAFIEKYKQTIIIAVVAVIVIVTGSSFIRPTCLRHVRKRQARNLQRDSNISMPSSSIRHSTVTVQATRAC